jgi:hypothetical protein
MRVEHLGAAGRLLETTAVKLGHLDDHPIHCVFYDAPTAWRLNTGDGIRVCLDQRMAGGPAASGCGPVS